MMPLSALIPLVAWPLFLGFLRRRGFDWRTAFLATAVLWGASVTLLTELLSLFEALNRPWLAWGWTTLGLVAGIMVFRSRTFPKAQTIPGLSRLEKQIVAAISVISACTFVIAIVSPPNNWDSMTYHMSRVMHWLQQESVAHFPTSILRQIEMNPWAEYAILQFQVLSGGDHLANLVQWFSMAGCIIGVSLIASLFTATARGQLLSGLIAATIPMGILQSSSTQNDLVVSFWLVCFVVFGILSVRDRSLAWTALMSLSLGLAVLTKGTAYVFSAPFVFWFFLQDVKRSWRHAAGKYLLLGIIVLFMNLGHYQRNFQLFHSPLQSGTQPYFNSRVTPAVAVSNISRNLAIHLLTPSETVNGLLLRSLQSLHSAIGIAIDDPGTSWPGRRVEAFWLGVLGIHEDVSGNLLHSILFMFAVAALACNKNLRSTLPYVLAVLAGFFLYCIMLRWHPWASRLHLPLFLLFSPVAGLVVAGVRKGWCERIVILFLPILALPWVLFNPSRPLVSFNTPLRDFPSIFTISRQSRYFINNPDSEHEFLAASSLITSSRFETIGLRSEDEAWEYPLWVLTRKKGMNGPRIEHVDVPNVSHTIPRPPFKPDCIVIMTYSGKVAVEVSGH
jgi:hypothetical protein